MIVAFQVLMIILILFFSVGLVGAQDDDMRVKCAVIVLGSIIAYVITLVIL